MEELPYQLEFCGWRWGTLAKPINEFGQTVEGGHNWKIDSIDGTFDTWDLEYYPYCMKLHCTECYEIACDRGCDGWEVFLEPCVESDNKNRQGNLF